MRKIVFIIILTCIAFSYAFPAFAQTPTEETSTPIPTTPDVDFSLGLANYFPIKDQDIKNGDIVVYSADGFKISRVAYDASIVGVVTTLPAVAIIPEGIENAYPIIATGNVQVRVVSQDGSIKAGDWITASDVKGAGMKATHPGFVIGMALAGYSNSNPREVGMIPVALNIHYYFSGNQAEAGLLDFLKLSRLATYEQPTVVFKYFIAGIVVLMTCMLGFLSFGRMANSGIVALGRNPLASRKIQIAIILNVIITLIIIGAGLGVAYFILNV